MKGALAPVLEPEQCRLDMLAGSQAIDAVVGAVAAVDGFGKRAYLDTIVLPFAGAGPEATEKTGILRFGFDLDGFIEAPQTAAFDFIGVTRGPAGRPGLFVYIFPWLLCVRHDVWLWYGGNIIVWNHAFYLKVPSMPFNKEPDGYEKTQLSDLRGFPFSG
jgi:hypothetical protein